MREHSPGSGSGTRLLHYSSTVRVTIWSTSYFFMDAGCVRLVSMSAIIEYACDSWVCWLIFLRIFCRLARPIFQPVVRLCLWQSYSVLTVCITSSLQNQANPFFSLANPSLTHTGLRSIVFPCSSTRREHFSTHTGFSTNVATRANTRTTHVEASLGSLA